MLRRWQLICIVALPFFCGTASCGGLPQKPKAAEPTAPACVRDSDCKGDRVCEEGACRTAPLDPDMLARLEDGEMTVASLRAALQHKWCGGPNDREAESCFRDGDCSGNQLCYRQRCTAPWNVPASERASEDAPEPDCTSDDHCKAGRRCWRGSCEHMELDQRLRLQVGALKETGALGSFAENQAKQMEGGDPRVALGSWLLLAHYVSTACGHPVPMAELADVARAGLASILEEEVDDAVAGSDCRTLAVVHQLDLWPYKGRFVSEIEGRKFTDAEVTRRTWLQTMKTLKKECRKRLPRRSLIAADATIEKLESIVGLDDSTLIELRTALLEALGRGDAEAVTKYALAVSEREKAIDARHAAAYEARVAELERKLADARAAAAAKPTASNTSGKRETTTLEDVNTALDTTSKALDTTKKTLDTVDQVRSMFGF